MNRQTEIEILAATLEEPSRSLLRASLAALRVGRLGAAATVSAHVTKRPGLAWPALLIALETAELRLAGAVAFSTPKSRFAASAQPLVFEERWGPFGCTVWPAGHKVRLHLVRDGSNALELRTAYDASPDAPEAELAAIGEAIGVVARCVEDCLGLRTRRVSVAWATLEGA